MAGHAFEEELLWLRDQNTQQQQRMQALEEQLLRQAAAQPTSGAEPQHTRFSLDDLKLGKPPAFNGDEAKWEDWDVKFRSWCAAMDREAAVDMARARLSEDVIDGASLGPLRAQRSARIFYALVMLSDGAALRIVRSVGDENGFEAYRLLARRYDPRSQARTLSKLHQILGFDFGDSSGALLDRVTAWERLIQEYDGISAEPVADTLKVAVLLGKVQVNAHLLAHAP